MLKKKEKLEQMRELGRGGLTKGLQFLRTAANNASVDNIEASSTPSLPSVEGEDTKSNRLSYEELLALTMKLTRQNKLMKIQFQTIKRKEEAISKSETDVQALRSFLELELGLDVAACIRTDNGRGGSIDMDALTEKYRMIAPMQQEEETKPQAIVESVDLLNLSPVAAQRMKDNDVPSKDDQGIVFDEIEINEAMQQVERMREVLKQNAQEMQALERKRAEQDAQEQERIRILMEEKKMLEEESMAWHAKCEALQNEQRDSLKEIDQQRDELENTVKELNVALNASKQQCVEQEQEVNESLVLVVKEKNELMTHFKNAREEVNVVAKEVDNVESNSARLQTRSDTLQAFSFNEEKKNPFDQLMEYELMISRLQEQVKVLQEESSSYLESEKKEIVAAAVKVHELELVAVKAENDRLQNQLLTVQDGGIDDMRKELVAEVEVLKKLNSQLIVELESKQQTEAFDREALEGCFDAKTVTALRTKVDALEELLATKNERYEALQEEVLVLKKALNQPAKQEIQEIREFETDADRLQELERVRLELVAHLDTNQMLEQKLETMEEQLRKAKSESEATESLVKALKEDTSCLADQVAHFKDMQTKYEDEIATLTHVTKELEKQYDEAQEANGIMAKQMEEERVYWTSKLEHLITANDVANGKIATLEVELAVQEQQVTKMTSSQTSMTLDLFKLQKEASSLRNDLAMATEALEVHATKAKDYEGRYIQSENDVVKLKKQVGEMRDRHHENFEMLRKEKETEFERVDAERQALVKDKKELCREKDQLELCCTTLKRELESVRTYEEELDALLSNKTLELESLSVDLSDTKKALSDRMALATRLQTENMNLAGKLAEQVALIESALRDAANSRKAQETMKTQVQTATTEIQQMKTKEDHLQQDLDQIRRELQQQSDAFQREREKADMALQVAVVRENQKFQREKERLETESKHKSKLALQAVLEKEKEIARLCARLSEVEEDVRSGGADNRKILEFAQLQAKREVEQRDQGVQMEALSIQLENARHEIHELHEDKRRHAEELTAMLQHQRRDGVNMEYLKNVVVQYMSFRPGTSQQARLVPVLSTLLQFTSADMKEIKHAAKRGSWTSWGNNVSSLDYKPIVVGTNHRLTTASPGLSSQEPNGRQSPLDRRSSAPVSRISVTESQIGFSQPTRFDAVGNDPVTLSVESADF
ncbi:hypothetical protein CCR75_001148 [Bremia lactucae]|uniref:GRIP domain-containing protein n=1 Tax=Bremia lactucae TaxID=4779 RepID=A0A976IFU9_BRELC|nr:hypothetical protein CCR75_001148 [Bremia lactucae]